MKKLLNKLNNKSIFAYATVASLFSKQTLAGDSNNVTQFRNTIGDTASVGAQVVSYGAYFLAGLLFVIAAWNIYKRGKTGGQGQEGGVIIGAIIAGILLISVVELAGLGTSAIFGTDSSDQLNNFGPNG